MTELKQSDKHFEFYVAGVQFHNINDAQEEITEGDELMMIFEPENKYDPNAIALKMWSDNLEREVMLGYVPKKINVEVNSFLVLGKSPVCKVMAYEPDAPPWNKLKAVIKERNE